MASWLTLIFANIGYFYTVVYIVAVLSCIIVKTRWSYKTALFLSAMAYPAWNPELWHNPESMGIYELFVICAMFVAYHGKMADRFLQLTFVMILINAYAAQYPFSDFYRHSLLNVIFFIQCVITIKASYNTRKLQRVNKQSCYDAFWNFTGHIK